MEKVVLRRKGGKNENKQLKEMRDTEAFPSHIQAP